MREVLNIYKCLRLEKCFAAVSLSARKEQKNLGTSKVFDKPSSLELIGFLRSFRSGFKLNSTRPSRYCPFNTLFAQVSVGERKIGRSAEQVTGIYRNAKLVLLLAE